MLIAEDGRTMALIFLLVYFFSIIFWGFSALAFCENRNELALWGGAKILSFSYILGAGISGLILFWMALIGLPPSRLWIIILFVVSLILFLFSGGFKLIRAFSFDLETKIEEVSGMLLLSFSVIAIILSIWIVFCNVFFTPLWDIDSFALWGFKSKAIYFSSLDKTSYFHCLNYGFSHLDYPLLVPFLNAGVYLCIGTVSQSAGKLLYFPLFLSFLAVCYHIASERMRKIPAIGLTALFASSPALLQWSGVGTADIYIASFLLISLYFSFNYLESCKVGSLAIAILANCLLAHTKNEGLAICILNILIIFLFAFVKRFAFSEKLKIFLAFLSTLICLIPWIIWSADIPRIHENYPARIVNILNPANLARIPDIFIAFFSCGSDLSRWGLFWFISIFSIIAYCGKKFFSPSLLTFFAIFAIYFLVFIISPWDVSYLSASALERLLLHLAIPAFFCMIASFSVKPLAQ